MNSQQNIPSQNQGGQNSSDMFSEMLGKILSSQVSDASSGSPVTEEPKTETKSSEPATATPQNPFGDMLSSILANPELLSKLPAMISAISPIMEMFSQPTKEKETTAKQAAAKPAGAVREIPKGDSDRRSALLCAMKPYLSTDRQNTIDYIIKLSRLGEILKTL